MSASHNPASITLAAELFDEVQRWMEEIDHGHTVSAKKRRHRYLELQNKIRILTDDADASSDTHSATISVIEEEDDDDG